jgi:hypothetical protein
MRQIVIVAQHQYRLQWQRRQIASGPFVARTALCPQASQFPFPWDLSISPRGQQTEIILTMRQHKEQ